MNRSRKHRPGITGPCIPEPERAQATDCKMNYGAKRIMKRTTLMMAVRLLGLGFCALVITGCGSYLLVVANGDIVRC